MAKGVTMSLRSLKDLMLFMNAFNLYSCCRWLEKWQLSVSLAIRKAETEGSQVLTNLDSTLRCYL